MEGGGPLVPERGRQKSGAGDDTLMLMGTDLSARVSPWALGARGHGSQSGQWEGEPHPPLPCTKVTCAFHSPGCSQALSERLLGRFLLRQ